MLTSRTPPGNSSTASPFCSSLKKLRPPTFTAPKVVIRPWKPPASCPPFSGGCARQACTAMLLTVLIRPWKLPAFGAPTLRQLCACMKANQERSSTALITEHGQLSWYVLASEASPSTRQSPMRQKQTHSQEHVVNKGLEPAARMLASKIAGCARPRGRMPRCRRISSTNTPRSSAKVCTQEPPGPSVYAMRPGTAPHASPRLRAAHSARTACRAPPQHSLHDGPAQPLAAVQYTLHVTLQLQCACALGSTWWLPTNSSGRSSGMPARPCCTLPSAALDRNTGLTRRLIVLT